LSERIQKQNQVKTSSGGVLKAQRQDWAWWCLPVILAIWEVELGGPQFEASPGKKFVRPPSQPIRKKANMKP
jgi:hypothetical protein